MNDNITRANQLESNDVRQDIIRGDVIAILWGIDDVKEVAPDLTDDEARKVLSYAYRKHDANEGINWIVLESIADLVLEER